MKLTLGFVGVGNIGESVCRHLIVHDVNPEALVRLEDTTAEPAASAALLARRVGVAPETFVEVMNASNGRSYSTEVKFPEYVLSRSFDDGFALGLMNKDLKIALEAAAEMEFPMPVGSALAQIWELAAAHGYGTENHTAIYTFLEELLGAHEG